MAENVTPVLLEVDGFVAREVLTVDYAFNQSIGVDNQITGNPRGGKVHIILKGLNDGNNQFLQWVLAETTPHNLTITYNNTIDGSTMKTIKCSTCYVAEYKLSWVEGEGIREEFLLTCKVIENGSVKYENPWK